MVLKIWFNSILIWILGISHEGILDANLDLEDSQEERKRKMEDGYDDEPSSKKPFSKFI